MTLGDFQRLVAEDSSIWNTLPLATMANNNEADLAYRDGVERFL